MYLCINLQTVHIYQNKVSCKSIVSHSDSLFVTDFVLFYSTIFFCFSYLNRQVCNGMNCMRIDSIAIWKYENVSCIFSLPAYMKPTMHYTQHIICLYDIFKWIKNNQEQHFVLVSDIFTTKQIIT